MAKKIIDTAALADAERDLAALQREHDEARTALHGAARGGTLTRTRALRERAEMLPGLIVAARERVLRLRLDNLATRRREAETDLALALAERDAAQERVVEAERAVQAARAAMQPKQQRVDDADRRVQSIDRQRREAEEELAALTARPAKSGLFTVTATGERKAL